MTRNFFKLFLSFTFITLTPLLYAKQTGGSVIIKGRINSPTCTVNVTADSSNTNQTVLSETSAAATIPPIEYTNIVSPTTIGNALGVAIGQTRTSTVSQFEQALNSIYASTGTTLSQGYAKVLIRVSCSDQSAFSTITYNVKEASGNTSSSYLPFDANTAADVSQRLELHNLIFFSGASANNLLWNNFQNVTNRPLPTPGSTQLDISSVNIITKKASAPITLGQAVASYTATQQISFTYN